MPARLLALVVVLVAPGAHAFDLAFKLDVGVYLSDIATSRSRVLVGKAYEDSPGSVDVYDMRTGKLLRTLRDPDARVCEEDGFGSALAATEHRVVVSGHDRVHVFDENGQLVRTHQAAESDGRWDIDGVALGERWLLAREWSYEKDLTYRDCYNEPTPEGAVHVFDVATGALLRTLVNPRYFCGGDPSFGAALLVVGDMAIVSTSGPAVCAFNVLDESIPLEPIWCTWSPNPHGDDYFGWALAAHGNHVLVGAPGGHRLEFGNAYLLDLRDGRVRRTYHGLERGSAFGDAVAIRRNRILVAAPAGRGMSTRGRTYLLDLGTGRVLASFRLTDGYYSSRSTSVAFGGRRLAIADSFSSDGLVRVFR